MIRKATICAAMLAVTASTVMAQDRVDITSFEESFEWAWTAGSIQSFVEPVPEPFDGENALVVLYDNGGSEWQFGTMNFPTGPVDLTGMREIHMSVFFAEGSTGELRIRLDLPGGNILGFDSIPTDEDGNPITGQWHELVFFIDRLSSQNTVSAVEFFQGFIVPTPGDAVGEVWIDNIFAVTPDTIPQVEEILVYDFEEIDPDTGSVRGWGPLDGLDALTGEGEVPPSAGDNFMTMFAVGGYAESNVVTLNAKQDFDNWENAREILFDVRIPEAVPGGWIQSQLTIVSGLEGDENTNVTTVTREIGYADATDDWKTLLYEFDITPHLPHINDPNGFFRVGISTNNDASALDFPVFVDNMRVAVPVGSTGGSNVTNWNLH